MKIDISGEAFELLEAFIYYSKSDTQALVDAMEYDIDDFKKKLLLLEKTIIDAIND